MTTQPITRQVRWQDLKVKNEVDIILEIAQKQGWEDCKIFGYGDMITQPQESKGWSPPGKSVLPTEPAKSVSPVKTTPGA